MKHIQQVKNKKGITIIYSLLGILIFTMVSIVIFNAATANYNRYIREHDNQQAYVTLTDAANVFIDSIAGDKVNFINESIDGVVDPSEAISWTYVEYGFKTPSTSTSTPVSFSSILFDFVKQRYSGDETTVLTKKFKIEADFDGDDDELETVYVDMTFENYDITAIFSNYDGVSEEPADTAYLTVIIPFVRDEAKSYNPVIETKLDISTVDNKEVITSLYKVEWDAGNVQVYRGKE